MGEKIRGHIRSNVVGYVALFVALSGTAYAANTVGSSDVIDESILSQDIKNGEVKNLDVGQNAIGTGKIVDGNVRTADVLDNDLTAADLASGAVGTEEIQDGAVSSLDVLDGSLTGRDVAGSSLTGADILGSSLTGSDILDGSLTGPDIANGSLTGSDIANSSLNSFEIVDRSLFGLDIAENSIGGDEINESDLDLAALGFVARDDGADEFECDGLLSSSQEVCADVSVILTGGVSRLFIVASGGWSKRFGDPAESLCRLQVDGQSPPEMLLFMGDNTGFGGGHSGGKQMPFTLNGTTDRLNPGSHTVTLGCQNLSSGGQSVLIGNAHISVITAG